MQTHNQAAMLLLIAMLSSCTKQAPDQLSGTSISSPDTNRYVLYVTRVSDHPRVQYPRDSLTEDQYRPDSSGRSYDVRFSAEGEQVHIQQDSIEGIKVSETVHAKTYELTRGLFAGGRFVVMRQALPVEAEFTIYGSGVPIISSERGPLIKKDN